MSPNSATSPPPRRRHRSRSRSRDRRRDKRSERHEGRDRDRGRRDRGDRDDRERRRDGKDRDRRERRDGGRSRSPKRGRDRGGREERELDTGAAGFEGATSITRGKPLPSQQSALKNELEPDRERSKSPEKANFNQTGILAKVANTTATGTVLKYTEPGEGRKPPSSQVWKLFVFKDGNIAQELELNEKSCWLFGRDRNVVDVPTDHPSCSSQHAVIQFRYIVKTNEFGDKKGSVKPYIIDLESSNGTFLAGEEIPKTRYVELRQGDMLKFGSSSREYVLMMDKA